MEYIDFFHSRHGKGGIKVDPIHVDEFLLILSMYMSPDQSLIT